MKYTGGPAQSVNIFRKKDRQSAEVIRQSFHARFGGAIEADIANTLAKLTTRKVREIVADRAPQRPGQEHPGETVFAEKITMRENTSQQQRDVALNHHQEKDRIETIAAYEVVKEIEMHDLRVSSKQWAVSRSNLMPGSVTAHCPLPTAYYDVSASCDGFTTRTGHEA